MKSFTLLLIFEFIVCVFCSEPSDILITENVTVISENLPKNSHFAYSLLLQKNGYNASIIVGAPGSPNMNGEVFKCTWNLVDNPYCAKTNLGKRHKNTLGANFLGSVIDGEDFSGGSVVICAPKWITNITSSYPSTKGYCLYIENFDQLNDNENSLAFFTDYIYRDTMCCYPPGSSYYHYAYAMGGFDVSYFQQEDEKKIYFGAPGVKRFEGTTAVLSLDFFNIEYKLPEVNNIVDPINSDTYFGYSVTTMKMGGNSEDVWFLAGAPRSNTLKGSVTLINYIPYGNPIVKSFGGIETGSYFGATVLGSDVNGDGLTDLLVAAPCTKGNSWDEGAVFVYYAFKYAEFKSAVLLSGTGKSGRGKGGGRFGTAISSLGDYDLDGFNDIAIAAPYEEDRTGAVYIYRGSPKGLLLEQRITPSVLKISTVVQGFGLGLSKGNDIDSNGHNDLAIGAYLTDQLFLLRSRVVIDIQADIASNISSITNSRNKIFFTICIKPTLRSSYKLTDVPVTIHMDQMDYRVVIEEIKMVRVVVGFRSCFDFEGDLKKFAGDISSLELAVRLAVEEPDILAVGVKNLVTTLPYNHQCGSDNVCTTGLSINITGKSELVLGRDNEIEISYDVNNDGETAYRCNIDIEVPDGLELRNRNTCYKNGTVYTCSVKDTLEKDKSFNGAYIFDVVDVSAYAKNLTILIAVNSLGENKPNYKNTTDLVIPIILQSIPYIDSKFTPENMELNMDRTGKTQVPITYEMSVGKTGPSPLIIDFQISIPVSKYIDESIFQIVDITGKMGDKFDISCLPTTNPASFTVDEQVTNTPINKTILISSSNHQASHYSCKGGYISNSRELAIIQVKLIVEADLLIKEYILELNDRDFIAFIPTAVQTQYPQGSVSSSKAFIIFAHKVSYIPLWAYLVAGIIAVVLLVVIVFGLFKCNFFKRNYKDKMEQEKILDGEEAIEHEIFEDDVFQRMESYEDKKSDMNVT